MWLNELDIKFLQENFDDETISKIDMENLKEIFRYLNKNNVYYVKDLLIIAFNLFLLPSEVFIKQFERLKVELGPNYVDKLSDDISLIEIMYQD